jgi:hypothetical protein
MSWRWVKPSLGRRMMADLSWASLRIPRCVMTARLRLPRALAARSALASPRPPWTTLFLKGFGLAAVPHPALRRCHATLPWPRMLEVEHAIGCVVLEREHDGESALSIARIPRCHAIPLRELAQRLSHAKSAPSGETPSFRRFRNFARLPWPLRRLLLRLGLATAGPVVLYGGTFAISALGERGVTILDSVSVLPIFLSYGPISPEGEVDVTLSFDHRVMDGADGADALRGLEQALEGPVADELLALGAA